MGDKFTPESFFDKRSTSTASEVLSLATEPNNPRTPKGRVKGSNGVYKCKDNQVVLAKNDFSCL